MNLARSQLQDHAGSWFQSHTRSHLGIMQDPNNFPRKILPDIFTRAYKLCTMPTSLSSVMTTKTHKASPKYRGRQLKFGSQNAIPLLLLQQA